MRTFDQPWIPVAASVVIGFFVVIGLFGFSEPSGFTRDVIAEQATAEAAVAGSPMAEDNPRTPGAVLLLTPLLLAPSDGLVWWVSLVSVASLGLIIAGLVRMTPDRHGLHIAVALLLPLTLPFRETIFHGNLFPVFAAAIVWCWVYVEEGNPVAAGVLLGMAGVSRIWPLLLLFVLVKFGQWRTIRWAVGTSAVLTIGGLMLPGVSVGGSVSSLVRSTEIHGVSPLNGSIPGVFATLGLPPLLGLVVVLVVWAVGLVWIERLRQSVGWTFAAAVLASPLAWAGYLLALTPLAAGHKQTVVVVVVFLVFGFVDRQLVVAGSVVALAVAGFESQARPIRTEV